MKHLNFIAIIFTFIAMTACMEEIDNPKNSDILVEPTTEPHYSEQILSEGRLPGKFSIGNGRYVYFSKGNLQYQASTNTWRFAEHQWDYVGNATDGNVYQDGVKSDNTKISSFYTGWIDLFGWGTSGWNSGAKAYQPWASSSSYTDYCLGGSYTNGLTGAYANADWGVYNKISNGGNMAGVWRTLTYEEWEHLLNFHIRGLATVNGVPGYIILPIGWNLPFIANPENWTDNTYSEQQWQNIESAGAVFLPCAGERRTLTIFSLPGNEYDQRGRYWSASPGDLESSVWFFNFWKVAASMWDFGIATYGQSVRLVQDVK